MDYEKEYNETLERAREIYGDPKKALEKNVNLTNEGTIAAIRVALLDLFKEEQLKWSEDERIRKVLIKYFKGSIGLGVAIDNVSVKDIVAWLEKQKERKPAAEEVLIRAGLKPFKDGNQWCILVGDNIQEGMCGFGDTIEDALYEFLKDVCKQNKPAEWSEEDKRKLNRIYTILGQAADTHAYSNTCRLIGDKEAVELQDFLRSITRLQAQEWSEEDEEMLRIISNRLDKFSEWSTEQGYPIDDPTMKQSPIDWLKSLRPQPKVEWNEEDEKVRKAVLDEIEHQIEIMPDADDMDSDDQDRYNELISMSVWMRDLPKCMKPHWKPSEEQMKEYGYWYRNFIKSGLASPSSKAVTVLGELLEQLKKL